MSFARGRAVSHFPVGSFISTTNGAAITTGTPAGKITVDGTSAAVSGTLAYDSDAGKWMLDGLSATEMDGELIGLTFTLTGAVPIDFTLQTEPAVDIRGSVDDASPTVSSFVAADGLAATDDIYNRLWLVFTSGDLQGISRQVSDYVGSTRTITLVDALPAAPADEDRFIIIGHGP